MLGSTLHRFLLVAVSGTQFAPSLRRKSGDVATQLIHGRRMDLGAFELLGMALHKTEEHMGLGEAVGQNWTVASSPHV